MAWKMIRETNPRPRYPVGGNPRFQWIRSAWDHDGKSHTRVPKTSLEGSGTDGIRVANREHGGLVEKGVSIPGVQFGVFYTGIMYKEINATVYARVLDKKRRRHTLLPSVEMKNKPAQWGF